jgi:hypothetical protein
MNLVVFTLGLVALFLFGTFVRALVAFLHSTDDVAAYKLYAVRDRVISLVAMEGVPRNDPWADYVYQSANEVLVACHLLAGPSRWTLASRAGHLSGEKPDAMVPSAPKSAPDPRLAVVLAELDVALSHAIRHHIGWRTFFQSRELRRKELARARAIKNQVHEATRTHSARLALAV